MKTVMNEDKEKAFICAMLDVIFKNATPDTPLHRARAIKDAAEYLKSKIKIKKDDREQYWTNLINKDYVILNKKNYILGLSEKGKEYLDNQ